MKSSEFGNAEWIKENLVESLSILAIGAKI